jgi:hypothetical protein
VSAKYKTKNIKIDCKEVFLARINHRRANTISRRNFRLTATRVYRVCLSGSLVWPFKKMERVINATTEKEEAKITMSGKLRFAFTMETSKYAVINNSTFKNTSNKMYL